MRKGYDEMDSKRMTPYSRSYGDRWQTHHDVGNVPGNCKVRVRALVSRGSSFDFMDGRSHHTAKGLSAVETQNYGN